VCHLHSWVSYQEAGVLDELDQHCLLVRHKALSKWPLWFQLSIGSKDYKIWSSQALRQPTPCSLCIAAGSLHLGGPIHPAYPVLPTKSAQQAQPALTTALTTSPLLHRTTTWRPQCLHGQSSWLMVLPTPPPMQWTAGQLARLSPGASTGCSAQVRDGCARM
jgi:hypothetical protein